METQLWIKLQHTFDHHTAQISAYYQDVLSMQ